MIKGFGLRVESFVRGRKHIKVNVTNGDTTKTVIFPASPSDRRWRMNMESYLRKTFNL